jgi:hypothetical protein
VALVLISATAAMACVVWIALDGFQLGNVVVLVALVAYGATELTKLRKATRQP